jgi:arylsulfatase A-like enzyme
MANAFSADHQYSDAPTCIAVRRAMLSGQRAQTHGMVGYHGLVEWDAPPTLPGVLRDAGYQTRLIGRSMHQHPPRRRYGFEEMETECHTGADDYSGWLARVGPEDNGGWFGGGVMHNDYTARPWPLEEHLHHTNWVMQRTLEFLRRRDPSCPYFLTIGFIAPHLALAADPRVARPARGLRGGREARGGAAVAERDPGAGAAGGVGAHRNGQWNAARKAPALRAACVPVRSLAPQLPVRRSASGTSSS